MKRLLACALILAPVLLSGCVLDTIVGDFVNSAPRAVIDAAPHDGVAPLTVSFDAHYSRDKDGTIVEYHWDFGDPDHRVRDGDEACVHTYSRAGTYLATLTVVDDEGATDSQQIAVVVLNPPPVPHAVASNDNPLPGNEVVFYASASYDADGTIASYHWDFGDDVIANGEIVRHTYASGGYFVVTLTLTDDEGATATTLLGINVQPGQSDCADDTTCGGGDPKLLAIIEAWPNPFSCSGGRANVEIIFEGFSVGGVGRIVSYSWDFGDGTTASGQRAAHTYAGPGNYKVQLTVVDEGGGTSTAARTAQIEEACN